MESLKGLNAARLAALNHGSIRSPIPGREKQEVLRRVRNWAAQVGEIKVGDAADPTVTLHLSGVDTEGILANADSVDNAGARRASCCSSSSASRTATSCSWSTSCCGAARGATAR